MLIVQYKNDKWASAQREFNNPRMFLSCQTRKINPAKISAFTVYNNVSTLKKNLSCMALHAISVFAKVKKLHFKSTMKCFKEVKIIIPPPPP